MPYYLKQTAAGEIALKEGPKLTPAENELLVKVSHIAQNPADWKQNEVAVNIGSTVGYEFAGTVESLGALVSNFSIGDRVAGLTFGNCPFNGDYGSHGEYCLAFPHVTFKIPAGLSSEEAAGLPVALMVAAQTLGQVLGYSWNEGAKNDGSLLIWGGGTAMGAIAIQLAKEAGISPIIVTAGTGREQYVKDLGADVYFDYNDPDAVQKIKDAAGESLCKGFDCAGNANSSTKLTGDCLGPAGGDVAILTPPAGDERKDVKFTMTLTATALGFDFKFFGMDFPKNAEDTEYMAIWWEEVAQPLLNAGKIKPHTTLVLPGGLSGVKNGWSMMKENKSYGKKLVYAVADTKFE